HTRFSRDWSSDVCSSDLRQSIKDSRLPANSPADSNMSYRLVCAAQTFASVIEELRNAAHSANGFARQIHSVFLYSNGDAAGAEKIGRASCREGVWSAGVR